MHRSSEHDRGSHLPPRIAARPNPSDWDNEELMTLAEAAELHWPHGPLTARSLRTAADAGQLPVVIVARKLLTSRRALQEMSRCQARTPPETAHKPVPVSAPHKTSTEDAYQRLMREIDGP